MKFKYLYLAIPMMCLLISTTVFAQGQQPQISEVSLS